MNTRELTDISALPVDNMLEFHQQMKQTQGGNKKLPDSLNKMLGQMNTQERTDFGNMSNSQQMNFHQMMKGQPAGGPSADKPKKLPDSLNKMLGQMNTQERTDFGNMSNSQQMNFHQMMKGQPAGQTSTKNAESSFGLTKQMNDGDVLVYKVNKKVDSVTGKNIGFAARPPRPRKNLSMETYEKVQKHLDKSGKE
jgi:uncharacterized protein YheU (UPF0270 family)